MIGPAEVVVGLVLAVFVVLLLCGAFSDPRLNGDRLSDGVRVRGRDEV